MRLSLALFALAFTACYSPGLPRVSDPTRLSLAGISIESPCRDLVPRFGGGFEPEDTEGWYGSWNLTDGRSVAVVCAETGGFEAGWVEAVVVCDERVGSKETASRLPAAKLGGVRLGERAAVVEGRLGVSPSRRSGEGNLYPYPGRADGVEIWHYPVTTAEAECPHFASVVFRDGRVVGLGIWRSDC